MCSGRVYLTTGGLFVKIKCREQIVKYYNHVFGTTPIFLKFYCITQLSMDEVFSILEILETLMGK